MKRLAALAAAILAVLAAVPAMASGFEPTRFTVTVEGHGPDVILIPGLASGRAVWDAEAARLKGHYRLHLIQLKGFAGEPAGPNATGPVLQPVVDEIHQYMLANHLTDAPVIGHSMGGLMGLLLAEQHPDDIKRLLVVDALPFLPMLFVGPGVTVAQVEPQAAQIRDQLVKETQEAFAAGEDAQLAALVKSPEGLALALAMAKASDHAVAGQAVYDDLTTDARPDLAKVKAKVVVLYPFDAAGMPTSAVDELYRGAYAAVPGVKLVRIDGSRHFIMYDQPDAFDREVQAFLGG
jgi:pimeloyl-ACP methyl ester carboxylesterase